MIRPVDPASDAGAITDIYNHYILHSDSTFDTEPRDRAQTEEQIRKTAERWPYIVATDPQGEIEGFAYVHPWKEKAAYASTVESTVYVHPEKLHRGTGRALMLALTDECRRRGEIHSIIACITAGNTASEKMHENLGFKRASYFKNVGLKHGRRLGISDWQLEI